MMTASIATFTSDEEAILVSLLDSAKKNKKLVKERVAKEWYKLTKRSLNYTTLNAHYLRLKQSK